jgi:hypothetical protein
MSRGKRRFLAGRTVGELLKGCKWVGLYRNDCGEVLLQPIAEIPASGRAPVNGQIAIVLT